jgi:hypothetical protein
MPSDDCMLDFNPNSIETSGTHTTGIELSTSATSRQWLRGRK